MSERTDVPLNRQKAEMTWKSTGLFSSLKADARSQVGKIGRSDRPAFYQCGHFPSNAGTLFHKEEGKLS
jgi:hypothetical protein